MCWKANNYHRWWSLLDAWPYYTTVQCYLQQQCLCVILIGLIRLIGLIGMCRPTASCLALFGKSLVNCYETIPHHSAIQHARWV